VCFDNGRCTPDILIYKIRFTLNFWKAGFSDSPIGGNHHIPKTALTFGPKCDGAFLITVDARTTEFEGYGSFVLQGPQFHFKSGEILYFTITDPLIFEAQTMLSTVQYAKHKQLRKEGKLRDAVAVDMSTRIAISSENAFVIKESCPNFSFLCPAYNVSNGQSEVA
ncbi:hypothetical protein Ancab_038907, partial [Ancistrocladus abbreviatus]